MTLTSTNCHFRQTMLDDPLLCPVAACHPRSLASIQTLSTGKAPQIPTPHPFQSRLQASWNSLIIVEKEFFVYFFRNRKLNICVKV